MARRGRRMRGPYTGGMPDPTVTAARDIFEGAIRGLRDAITGLGAEALNWRPAGDDTNPIAVLAVHAMGSTRSWLAVAFGAPLPDRDRDAEFRTAATGEAELLARMDGVVDDCRHLFDATDAFDPGVMRTSHFRTSAGQAEVVSGAWALLHATEHLSEHVGHAQLTRQLWERREA
jgi:DinB superfamily